MVNTPFDPERLSLLTRNSSGNIRLNLGYSRFVRWMRLVLPVLAISIVAVVMSWSILREQDIDEIRSLDLPELAEGRTELVNPRFQSRDEKDRPYTITARRALQGQSNEELVILDTPSGTLALEDGRKVSIEAQRGAFRRDTQRLLLRGEVTLYLEPGYTLGTAQLQMDLKNRLAWSDNEVAGEGPAGSLQALGMRADIEEEHLLFSGPAKLVLYQEKKLP